VLERFGFDFPPRTGEVGVVIGPGWVGGQVAFPRSRLVNSPRNKFP